MDKEAYLRFIASFMAALILTIPFYTTSAYATINSVRVKGSEGIENYVKRSDFVEFTADVSIPGTTVTAGQVRAGEIPFDSCTASTNSNFICTLKYPPAGNNEFWDKVDYAVNLLKSDGTQDSVKAGTIIVDGISPQVTLTPSKSKFSLADQIKVEYDTTDTACNDPAVCSGKCSGIKNVEIYTLDNLLQNTIDLNTPSCNSKANVVLDASKLKNGANTVFVKAVDQLGQPSIVASASFTLDKTPPVPQPSSYEIIRKGIVINSYAPRNVVAEINVSISSDDLDLASATADLTSLGAGNTNNVAGTCSFRQPELAVCTWPVQFNPGSAGSKSIRVKASETSGNTMDIPLAKSLTLDDKGPVVTSLATTKVLGTQSYAMPTGNTVIAMFDEATGIAPDEVFLHVGSSALPAKNCTKETVWKCAWDNVAFAGVSSMSIETDTTDILGNTVSEVKSVTVNIDTTAPVFKSINITPTGNSAISGIYKVGDRLRVEINITDNSDVSAAADFSSFITGATNVAGSCTYIQQHSHYNCIWNTNVINLAASSNINFAFSDAAGNTLARNEPFTTLGVDGTPAPDYWNSAITCSPSVIDRSTGTLINRNVYCSVQLSPKTSTQVSTVSISQPDCTDVIVDDKGSVVVSDFLSKTSSINTAAGSTSPIVKITLQKSDFNIDNATIRCSLNIISRLTGSNTITTNPEIENVPVLVKFYNLPLGELSDAAKQRIKDAKRTANTDLLKFAGKAEDLISVAKRICQAINTMYTITSLLYGITITAKIAAAVCHLTIVGDAVGVCTTLEKIGKNSCDTSEKSSGTADKLKKNADKFCELVTCKRTIDMTGGMESWFRDRNVKVDLLRDMDIGSKYDPRNNLIVGALSGCLPGVITGLEKYRQIQCQYADCLENAVAKEGLPISACSEQWTYSSCKYVTGEIFAVFPVTAFIDHWLRLFKQVASNPFNLLGLAASKICKTACPVPADGGASLIGCRGARLLKLAGDALENINSFKEPVRPVQDYCANLNFDDLEEAAEDTEETE